jgi:hypothetical protein
MVGGAADGVWSDEASGGEGLLGFTEDNDRGAAAAGCDAKAGGEAHLELIRLEWFCKDVHAEPFGEHDCVDCAASGEGEEELVITNAA